MSWLPVADGPLPLGDIIYGLGIILEGIGLISIADKSIEAINNYSENLHVKNNLEANAQSVTPESEPPENETNDEKQETEERKPTSQNQMQKQVERGKAPREVERVDKAHQQGGQNHVHFKDGTSLNQDGSVHDAHKGTPSPTNATKDWLKNNGWNCGE